MLENVYEGLNARPKVYLSKEYFCEMYPTCVSSKLCEFISNQVGSSKMYGDVLVQQLSQIMTPLHPINFRCVLTCFKQSVNKVPVLVSFMNQF